MKKFVKGREFKYYDILKDAQENLKKDFFAAYPTYQDLDNTYVVSGAEFLIGTGNWKVYPLKYTAELYESQEHNDVEEAMKFIELHKDKFPTACGLVDYFGDAVKTAAYLVLEADTLIDWHFDSENSDGKLVCIHIPLDIPEGDLGLEVEDEIERWEDIFAYNSQKIHRAWNYTDKSRLIFIMDFTTESCGLEWL
jgi:hypothetical protein